MSHFRLLLAGAGAAAVAPLGCGTHELPGIVETRDFASGTRLAARTWDVDGALVLRDFVDRERGEPCAFSENGGLHVGPGPSYWCLPLAMAQHDPAAGPFADAKCAVPVAIPPASGAAVYALTRVVDACASAPAVHRAAPAAAMPTWVLDGGQCRSAGPGVVQKLEDEVTLDAFVRAVEVPEPRGAQSRVGALALVGADGSRMTLGGYDTQRREPVRIDGPIAAGTYAGTYRWVPSRVAFVGAGTTTYGDAACASAIATKSGADAICPPTAALVFEAQCADTTSFRALGAPVDPMGLHQRSPTGTCEPFAMPGLHAYAVGDAIADATLAPAKLLDAGGAGARRRGYADAAASGASDAIVWTDVIAPTTGEPCEPVLAVDGTMRCLPAASATVSLFGDASCTTPAYAEPLTGCNQPAPRFVRGSADESQGARAFEIVGPLAALYARQGSSCVAFMPVVASRGFAVKEVDVATFPMAIDRTL